MEFDENETRVISITSIIIIEKSGKSLDAIVIFLIFLFYVKYLIIKLSFMF